MAKKLNRVLVIDVESTCWKGRPPGEQVSEIIQVGIVGVNTVTCLIEEKYNYLVEPKFSDIGEFCTKLTGINPEDVHGLGFDYIDFCREIKTKIPHLKDYTWASYGDYDRRQFERMSKLFKESYLFGPSHINIKNLFALVYGLPKEVGMMKALELLNISHTGKHHNALDDALNIAKIFIYLLRIGRKEDRVLNHSV